ncbi:MAG: hypothetical protein ACLS37_10505 [Alistipes sp.]
MKIPRFIACLTALLCMAAGCRSEDDAAVRALARRIIPEHENSSASSVLPIRPSVSN